MQLSLPLKYLSLLFGVKPDKEPTDDSVDGLLSSDENPMQTGDALGMELQENISHERRKSEEDAERSGGDGGTTKTEEGRVKIGMKNVTINPHSEQGRFSWKRGKIPLP